MYYEADKLLNFHKSYTIIYADNKVQVGNIVLVIKDYKYFYLMNKYTTSYTTRLYLRSKPKTTSPLIIEDP